MRYVSNNTPAAIYGSYKQKTGDRVVVGNFLFKPGLNEVPDSVLSSMLQEPGFNKMLEDGRLSGKKGDIDAAKDVKAAQDKGEDSKTVVPPVKPENSTKKGAPLSKTQEEATRKAKDKPVSTPGA